MQSNIHPHSRQNEPQHQVCIADSALLQTIPLGHSAQVDMVVKAFTIFIAFHATGPMGWLDFTGAIENYGDSIDEQFSLGKLRKVGLGISNQVNGTCLFRINFHFYLMLLDYL